MERELISIFFLYQKLKEILIRYSQIILPASKDRLISKNLYICTEGPRLTRFLGLGKNRVT